MLTSFKYAQWERFISAFLMLKERNNANKNNLKQFSDSVVGIATGYGLDDQGILVLIPVGSRIFSSPRRPDRLGSTQPPIPEGKAAGA
jgi:hypothetical protein